MRCLLGSKKREGLGIGRWGCCLVLSKRPSPIAFRKTNDNGISESGIHELLDDYEVIWEDFSNDEPLKDILNNESAGISDGDLRRDYRRLSSMYEDIFTSNIYPYVHFVCKCFVRVSWKQVS